MHSRPRRDARYPRLLLDGSGRKRHELTRGHGRPNATDPALGDHVAPTRPHHQSGGAKATNRKATIFGSVFKRNGARSTLKLVGCDEDVRELVQDKSNFGPNTGGIRYEMLFERR